MRNLEKSFKNLLIIEKKAKDIYDKMMENGLDEESLKKIKWIETEEIEHIRKAEALIILDRNAYKREPRLIKKETADYFKKDFIFKRNLLGSVNRLIDTRIEMIEFLALLGKDNEKFSKINKTRQSLVDKITHDIKTPLTVTSWLTESLLEGKKNLSQEQKEMVKDIGDANQSIISFVEDLLLAEKIEESSIQPKKEELDLARLSEDTLKQLSHLFKSRKQKVVFKAYQKNIIVNSNKESLKTIISNLLSNASQYGLQNDIDFEIRKKDKAVLIAVSDKGIGIPEEQHKNIFKKFFRTDNAKMAYDKGSGLGLYVVKGLVDSIGGKIWFESEENKGTTFYVLIN